jgi:hypothetical protein
VENGDTLVSEKNTYAQIRFVDNSEITLKPGTTFRIENFSYDAGKPDARQRRLQPGQGRPALDHRPAGQAQQGEVLAEDAEATIGIRGTTFIAAGIRIVNEVRHESASDQN